MLLYLQLYTYNMAHNDYSHNFGFILKILHIYVTTLFLKRYDL